jgi:hypothetical protein
MLSYLHQAICNRLCLATFIVLLTGFEIGCTPSTTPSAVSPGDGQKNTKTGATASLSDTAEVTPGSSEDAKRLLAGSLANYRTLDRYSDAGEVRIEHRGDSPITIPFRVALERPNRLALASHQARGTWTATTWEGYCGEPVNPFPNQRLVRPLPNRIDLPWIANDLLGGLLLEPIGIPIQLEWLLSSQSMDALDDPTCKLEFLQRDMVDGRTCDRVRMEVKDQRWVFWIDREDQLVRRMELPPSLFYPGIAPDRSSEIRCEINFREATANTSIDWSRWQIPDRPYDVRVRRMVMPPPIASTQILGSTLEPFDLRSSDGSLLLDAAEPKRPVSVLCWVDSSARSEAYIRELMVLRKALSEQEWGGRCGIYLIGRENAEEIIQSLKQWNCDLPLAIDTQNLSETVFKFSTVPSLVIMDRDRRVQVAETLVQPIFSQAMMDLVRRTDSKEDLASRQLQQDADNQARFIAALHRVAIDRDEIKKLDAIREFQFALHGMRRLWRTEIEGPLVSAAGAWHPEAAIADPNKSDYPFAGLGKHIVMSVLDDTGKVLVLDDLGNKSEVAKVEIDQADGAKRIHMAIDPWSRKWIAIVPEGLPRFWITPSIFKGTLSGTQIPSATTYNTGDAETPVAFAWTSFKSDPAIAIATSESRLLVIDPENEKRLDAFGESTIGIAPGLDANGRVSQWNAVSENGRLVRIRNLGGEAGELADSPIEARLEQLTFVPRGGNWLWGRQNRDPVTFCLANLPSGETGVIVCDMLHQAIRSRPVTAIGEQSRLLSTVRLTDGTLYGLALGPNRVLHLFTSDLQIMDHVSFDARIYGAALFADAQDLKLVVALEKEVSAWSIDVPDRPKATEESISPNKP